MQLKLHQQQKLLLLVSIFIWFCRKRIEFIIFYDFLLAPTPYVEAPPAPAIPVLQTPVRVYEEPAKVYEEPTAVYGPRKLHFSAHLL